MSKVVVMGQGYVGLPMALRAAKCGHQVMGLDISSRKVELLNSGRSHIGDVSDEYLQSALADGYAATADPQCLKTAEAIIVCVPTPLSEDGGPDLAAVEEAGRTIGMHVQTGTLVILESTTYPGTTEEIFAPLVAGPDMQVGRDIHIAFSPERIDPGNEVYHVENTPKVVGGLTADCTRAAKSFYSTFIETVVEAKTAREAEMAKLLENTFRHVNIALVNEMVRFCHELDIDLWNAIECADTKPFGYMAFRPGPGVGGHCIPVDPSYLSHRVKAKLGYAFRMVELAEEINHAAPNYVASRVVRLLNDLGCAVKGTKILLVGVTYKPNVADQRESPADPLAAQLQAWGADVSYFDPFVASWDVGGQEVRREADVYLAAKQSELVVLMQPHDEIDLSELVQASRLLLDTRGVVPEYPSVERL